MTSPDMHTLAGAYALDALDEHERARFRRHLDECAACRQEVAELQATAARLGAAMGEEPPAELKDRVLTEVRTTRQQPPSARSEERERLPRDGLPRWALVASIAAAVVGLALAGVFGGVALHTNNQLEAAQSRLDAARERYQPVAELLTAPDARVAHARSSIGGAATVVVSRSRDAMMIMGSDLPPQGDRQDYELWLVGPDNRVHSAGVLPADSLLLAEGVDTASGLAVTVEPEGGSPNGQPSSAPILRMEMPA